MVTCYFYLAQKEVKGEPPCPRHLCSVAESVIVGYTDSQNLV